MSQCTFIPLPALAVRRGRILLAATCGCLWLSVSMAQAPVPPSAPPPEMPEPQSGAVESASPVDAYAEFRREYDAARYAEALPHARRVLELAEQQASSPTAEEVQVALMNLGMVQNLSGDYVGAEDTYQRVIGLVERSGRPLNARLARAYAGLASAYHDGKRHDLAVKNFEQAIALTRRHEGLLTDRQVPLVEKYIDSLTVLGKYEQALQAQKYLLRIATRQHGSASVEIVPTLVEIGKWYASVSAYDQARRMLRQAIEIVEAAEGPQSQRLISPLTALASCNRRQLLDPTLQQVNSETEEATRFNDPAAQIAPTGYTPAMLYSEGERALLRAAEITDAGPTPAPLQVLNVHTQLGDWYQLRMQWERALPHYRQAWLAAARIPDKIEGKAYTEAIFGKPVLLHIVRPDNWNRYAGRKPDTIEIRTVVIETTVNAEGRAVEAKMIDDSGDAKRADRSTRALLDTARYRPRFDNGEPRVTAGVTFNQPWILLLPEPAGSGGAAPADEKPAGEKPSGDTPPPAPVEKPEATSSPGPAT